VLGTLTHQTDLPVDELKPVDELQGLSIFHGYQQGTNFRVADEEGRKVLSIIEEMARTQPQRGDGQ
jgi:hypothetical protein